QAAAFGVSFKEGGRQIEYEDQDPYIHKLYLEELVKHGGTCRMSEYMDDSILLKKMGESVDA
ncbi:MAG: hypothetical protein ACI82H_001845, partial [Alphaproteobacteria bacterium]